MLAAWCGLGENCEMNQAEHRDPLTVALASGLGTRRQARAMLRELAGYAELSAFERDRRQGEESEPEDAA